MGEIVNGTWVSDYSGAEIDERLSRATPWGTTGVNLLDNAYFIGAGTPGAFPVNQRGQNSYNTNNAYSIDRWKVYTNASASLYVLSTGIKLDATAISSGAPYVEQIVEEYNCIPEKTYTFSALAVDASSAVGWYLRVQATVNGTLQNLAASINSELGLKSVTFTIPSGASGLRIQIGVYQTRSVTVAAAKLELGDTQTLARQVNGEWVLNDPPPNYAEELAKCQMYLVEINPYGDEYGSAGYGIAVNSTKIRTKLQLPVTPRTVSSIETVGAWVFQDYTSGTALSPSGTPSGTRTVGNGVTFDWTVSGATAGRVYLLQANNDATARMRVISSL